LRWKSVEEVPRWKSIEEVPRTSVEVEEGQQAEEILVVEAA
jgi:hypothetical protein